MERSDINYQTALNSFNGVPNIDKIGGIFLRKLAEIAKSHNIEMTQFARDIAERMKVDVRIVRKRLVEFSIMPLIQAVEETGSEDGRVEAQQ